MRYGVFNDDNGFLTLSVLEGDAPIASISVAVGSRFSDQLFSAVFDVLFQPDISSVADDDLVVFLDE